MIGVALQQGRLVCSCEKRGIEPFGPNPRPPTAGRDWGCDEEAPVVLFELDDGTEYRRCPRKLLTSDAIRVLNLCDLFLAHGLLPVAGGALDQTGVFLDALGVVARERARGQSDA